MHVDFSFFYWPKTNESGDLTSLFLCCTKPTIWDIQLESNLPPMIYQPRLLNITPFRVHQKNDCACECALFSLSYFYFFLNISSKMLCYKKKKK